MESNTIIGIFADKDHANNAIDDVKKMGLNPKDMSIMVKDVDWAKEVVKGKGVRVAESTATGAGTGLAIGALAGLLVGLGTIAVPGIGALFIGGPLVSMLGLTGAAETTVAGAATGAIAGGIVGALVGLGLPRQVAEVYQERLNQGAVVLAVPVRTVEEQDEVIDIFDTHMAENVHVIGRGRMSAMRHHTRPSTVA